MNTNICTTIVLLLLWLSLCCHALGFLLAIIREYSSNEVLYSTTTLSTVLLGICLWQCQKAGHLVWPLTWYHWVLLILLVLLQVLAVVLEQNGWGLFTNLLFTSTYPIYGIVVVLLGILGGTLFCGWKCNLFCRPCCKSQYVCYGSAIVVVLLLLVVVAVTASLPKEDGEEDSDNEERIDHYEGETKMQTIGCLGKILIPITQCYAMAVIWNTILKLPYTVPDVVTLLASAMAVASILALGTSGSNLHDNIAVAYSLLAVHLLSLVITWYLLEYKGVFYWPKDDMCFGILATVVILVALALVVIHSSSQHSEPVEYTLLGYSLLLLVPVFWYAYRCGLLTWRWNSCLPKKKGLTDTDTAESTTPDTDIAKE